MTSTRLEAFSDAVIAIVMTIMVLEMKVPHGTDWESLRGVAPVLLSYVLSFIYLGIYWNNHHHLFHLVERVSGRVLWGNLHLLFWLSLVPFVTGWMGENHAAPLPTAVYGIVLLMAAVAWTIMQATILSHHGPDAELRHALGRDIKGKLSIVFYVAGVALAFVHPWFAIGFYILVALMWLIPDRRIESRVRA